MMPFLSFLTTHNGTEIGVNEFIKIAFQHSIGICGLVVCPVVLYHFIGVQDIAPYLISPSRINSFSFESGLFLSLLLQLYLQQTGT